MRSSRCSWARRSRPARTSSRPRPGRSRTLTSEVPVLAGGSRVTGDQRPADPRFEVEPHRCFACGSLSEHGMRLDLHVSGERCWTELELADRFQGWDGIAHGGIVCTILDEVMAWVRAPTPHAGTTGRRHVT